VIHVAAAAIVIAALAATVVAVGEADSADYADYSVVAAAADVDTGAVVHFEELQKLYLLGPSC